MISMSDLTFGCLRCFTEESVVAFFHIAPEEALKAMTNAVESAPSTDVEWQSFMILQPECDPVQLTTDFRRGVLVVRRYLESR